MNQHTATPHSTDRGVMFTVTVDSLKHECLIEEEALRELSVQRGTNASDTMVIFHAFEDRISGVARRLVAAGVKGNPLVLTSNTFSAPPRRV